MNGLEPTADLAKAGRELSIKAGMEKKADIVRYAPEGFEPKQGSVDCILSSESLYLVDDKVKLLNIVQVIDPGNISKYQNMMRGS